MTEFKKAVDDIVAFRDIIPASAKAQTDPPINNALKALAAKKEAARKAAEEAARKEAEEATKTTNTDAGTSTFMTQRSRFARRY